MLPFSLPRLISPFPGSGVHPHLCTLSTRPWLTPLAIDLLSAAAAAPLHAAARSFTSAPQALGAAIGTAAILAIIGSETKRR